MQLDPLPEFVQHQVLVGGAVRKSPAVLQAHLDSVAAQILPKQVRLVPAYVDDNEDERSSELLSAWCAKHGGLYLDVRGSHQGGFSDQDPQTHQWQRAAMQRVGELKNQIIGECITGKYAALWLLDADLVLHPRTSWSLWHCDRPITCAVFWTRWQNDPGCLPHPQVWLRHPYNLDGRGMDWAEFIRHLHDRQLVQVWGQGACTLYKREVLEKGVNFTYLPDLPTEGMWNGEDRHLCTRAERLHVPMFADAWPDIHHLYHPHEQARAGEAGFPEEAPVPGWNDLVSVQLQPLEPIQGQDGGWMHLAKQHIRGRLGTIPLIPELREVVPCLARGESKIVSVRFPEWSESAFRGQRRLIEVTLIDHKPDQPAPGTT